MIIIKLKLKNKKKTKKKTINKSWAQNPCNHASHTSHVKNVRMGQVCLNKPKVRETRKSLKLCILEKNVHWNLELFRCIKFLLMRYFGWCAVADIVMEEQELISWNPNRVYDRLVSFRSLRVPFFYPSLCYSMIFLMLAIFIWYDGAWYSKS